MRKEKVSKTPRTEAAKGFFDLDSAVSAEFASELETELNDAHKAFVVATDQLVQAQSELRQAREENAKLREALEKIKSIEDRYECGDWDEIEEAREIARQALTP